MTIHIDPTKSARENLLALVNHANSSDITTTDVILKNITPIADAVVVEGERNTSVSLEPTAAGRFSVAAGGVTVNYRRLSFAELITNPVEIKATRTTTLTEIHQAVCNAYGLIHDGVLTDGVLPGNGTILPGETFEVIINTTESGSLVYLPTPKQINITWDGVWLEALLTNTALSGFEKQGIPERNAIAVLQANGVRYSDDGENWYAPVGLPVFYGVPDKTTNGYLVWASVPSEGGALGLFKSVDCKDWVDTGLRTPTGGSIIGTNTYYVKNGIAVYETYYNDGSGARSVNYYSTDYKTWIKSTNGLPSAFQLTGYAKNSSGFILAKNRYKVNELLGKVGGSPFTPGFTVINRPPNSIYDITLAKDVIFVYCHPAGNYCIPAGGTGASLTSLGLTDIARITYIAETNEFIGYPRTNGAAYFYTCSASGSSYMSSSNWTRRIIPAGWVLKAIDFVNGGYSALLTPLSGNPALLNGNQVFRSKKYSTWVMGKITPKTNAGGNDPCLMAI